MNKIDIFIFLIHSPTRPKAHEPSLCPKYGKIKHRPRIEPQKLFLVWGTGPQTVRLKISSLNSLHYIGYVQVLI